jgi:hypothetical protein
MKTDLLQILFNKYISLLSTLGDGSVLFSDKLIVDSNVDFAAFDTWRQKLIKDIQNVDTELHQYLSATDKGLSPEQRMELEAFKLVQKEQVGRILQADAVILTFTEKLLDQVREVLSNLTHGRRALQSYGSSGSSSALVLDHDV